MRQEEIKVGQTIVHENGFVGIVKEVEGINVTVEITDSGTSCLWHEGELYVGMAEFMTLVKDVPTKLTSTIEIEVQGLEQLEALAEEMSAYESEQSVFKAKLGHGVEFEGTKSDFETFTDGLIQMMKLGNLFK